MIALIRGKMVHRSPEYIIVDVNGVGYRLIIPLSTFYNLPDVGSVVALHIYTCVREDSLNLYGFISIEEKELFEKLIAVSKVGPRLALNLLSGLPPAELENAIAMKDVAKLSSIPGVGLKTAERLVLELKDKVALKEGGVYGKQDITMSDEESRMMDDVLAALVNLGYKKKDAEKALKSTWEKGERNVEVLIRKSLARLSR